MKHIITSTTKPTVAGVDMNETKQDTNQKPEPGSPNFIARQHDDR